MDLQTDTLRCDGCGEPKPVATMSLLIAQKAGDIRPKTKVLTACHMCLSKAHLALAIFSDRAVSVAS